LARNHAFLDGNKRTAITATGIFLSMNNRRLEASQKELVQFVLEVAVGNISDREAAKWLKKHSTPVKK
jgi:death-on-curing protein